MESTRSSTLKHNIKKGERKKVMNKWKDCFSIEYILSAATPCTCHYIYCHRRSLRMYRHYLPNAEHVSYVRAL